MRREAALRVYTRHVKYARIMRELSFVPGVGVGERRKHKTKI